MTGFNAQGYGVDATKDIVIYHRWGAAENGQLERFIIVLNFSAYDHDVNTYGFTPTGSTIEFYPANFRFGSNPVCRNRQQSAKTSHSISFNKSPKT